MQIDLKQLAQKFNQSEAMNRLEKADRDVMLYFINSGDEEFAERLSKILDEEDKFKSVLNSYMDTLVSNCANLAVESAERSAKLGKAETIIKMSQKRDLRVAEALLSDLK